MAAFQSFYLAYTVWVINMLDFLFLWIYQKLQGGGGLLPFSNGLCDKIPLIEKSCLELTKELS